MQKTGTKTPVKTATKANTGAIWNKVAFTGRLGRDPEMHYSPQGKAITQFSIAVNQGKTKDAMWLDIVAWEGMAEHVNTDAMKGTEVQVIGRLTQESWTDKNTQQKRKAFKVVASEVTILRNGKEDEGNESGLADDNDPLGELDEHPF